MSLARMTPFTGRSGSGRSWPAWVVLAVSIGLWATSVSLGRAHGPLTRVPVFDVVDVVTYSAVLAWTVVGNVIIGRRPDNRIGWLLLLFPTGHLPGPAGAGLPGSTACWPWPASAAWRLLPGARPGGYSELGPIPNPRGWEAAAEVLRPIDATAAVLATALVGVAAVSTILRLRRARGVQRQQLTWLADAAVVLAGYYLLAYLYTRGTIRSIPPLVGTVVSGLSLVVVPAAIGMAVLRYRLYNIDRIINHAAELGGRRRHPGRGRPVPTGPPRIHGRLTAASTGAGTTRPKTIEAFSTRPRDQIDLDTLATELMAVVDQSMEPTRSRCGSGPPPTAPQGRRTVEHGRQPGPPELPGGASGRLPTRLRIPNQLGEGTTRMGFWLRTNSGG